MTAVRAALVLLGAAFLTLVGSEGSARWSPPGPAEPIEHVGRVREAFRTALEDAESTARCALDRGPSEAAARCVSGRLRGRLEGVARVGAGGEWIDWAGAPTGAVPPKTSSGSRWSLLSHGMRHSLAVRTPPDADGRAGVAWFTLESAPDADVEWIRVPGTVLGVDLPTVHLLPITGDSDPAPLLHAPDGVPLARLRLEPSEPAASAARTRAIGRAVAGLLTALALAVAAAAPSIRALSWVVPVLLVAARLLLVAGGTFEVLLPRGLGGPSLYGAPGLWGLLASPAALAATAAAWLALAVWGSWTRRSAALLGAASVASGVALAALAAGLARDGRVALLSLASAFSSPGHAALLLGLSGASLATAVLIQGTWRRASGRGRGGAILGLAILGSALVASEAHLGARSDLLAERLRSEYAPLVSEQSARRRLALEAHVAEVARSPLARDLVSRHRGAADPSAGWVLWSRGPLGIRGWLSSIDLLAPDGSIRARFAFGLPPLQEPFPAPSGKPESPATVREESITFGASEQRLLHAEATIPSAEGEPGRVVAHVLDEPDNLPFLPGVALYLAALGSPATPPEGPDYVLYGNDGRVLLSTLPRPPARSPAWKDPSAALEVVPTTSGGTAYLGMAIPGGDAVHLLLAASGGGLERAGALTRVALLEALLLAAGAAGFAFTGRTPEPRTRPSFYRKLLAAMLGASLLPLFGLALFLRGSIEEGAERSLQESSANIVGAVRRVVEDYAAVIRDDEDPRPLRVDDGILSWLRGLVGQDIHLYQDGVVAATSKPELFESGLLSTRLPGDVRTALLEGGEPTVVRDEPFGGTSLPVAYARADLAGTPAVVAVPLILERREIGRAMARGLESLLLATVLLGALLAAASAWVARTVSRPVRELVEAAGRVAKGDYETRLQARSRDELASLADGFNAMAAALSAQRADLERRRDYMEALLRHATLGVVSTDPEGTVITMNPAAGDLLGEAGASVSVGGRLAPMLEREPALRSLWRLLERPLPETVEPEEIDLRIPDSPRRLRVVRVALPDPAGGPPGALVLLDDVTELARSSQLAAWAEMARAIAHEIKNPLTPIQLSTEHLERLLRDRRAIPDADIEACLRSVLGQVRALREIAGEFSAYAKLPDLAPESRDVSEFLREAIAPYRAALPDGVRLEEHYATDRPCALDDRAMGRAVANLVENALHAMPEGGVLRVSTSHDAQAGEVTLCVADTGTGLSPEARDRLFEPYFSTKTSGTGLGLAIVLRTVQAHGGRIDVESAAGSGTSFRVHLPVCR